MTTHISICIVTFQPDLRALATTLLSLRAALRQLRHFRYSILLVDNSPDDTLQPWLDHHFPCFEIRLVAGHGNIGFGRANNLALPMAGDIHLVLNPDVELLPDALTAGVAFLADNACCGLITPLSYSPTGERQYLCKRFPALLDLALRGFAPDWLRAAFARRLSAYEMREMEADRVFWTPPIVSGCFMLIRGDIFRRMGGFDPDYFLYFEDFDLSLRAARLADIAFVPAVRIVHGGGNAAKKGFWHIRVFARSARTFYAKWGLKVV